MLRCVAMAQRLEGEADPLSDHRVNLRKQRRRGRRSHLDRKLVHKIVKLIASGADQATAAESLGYARQRMWDWMKKGREHHQAREHTIYAYLYQCVLQADGAKRQKLERSTYAHAMNDGRLGLSMLGKMDRETWGDKPEGPTVNINIGVTPDMRLLAERLTPDELADLARLLAKAFGSEGAGGGDSAAGAIESPGVHAIDVPGIPGQLAPPTDR